MAPCPRRCLVGLRLMKNYLGQNYWRTRLVNVCILPVICKKNSGSAKTSYRTGVQSTPHNFGVCARQNFSRETLRNWPFFWNCFVVEEKVI